MRKLRVVVSVEVPDDDPATEKQLVWRLKGELPRELFVPFIKIGSQLRKIDISEYSRVVQYEPGGVRGIGERNASS